MDVAVIVQIPVTGKDEVISAERIMVVFWV
jgi:hypothetical protein